MEKDSNKRPSCIDALKHPWLNGKKMNKGEKFRLVIDSDSNNNDNNNSMTFNKARTSRRSSISIQEEEEKKIEEKNGEEGEEDAAVLSKFEDLVSLVKSTRLQQVLLRGVRQILCEDDRLRFANEFKSIDKNKDGYIDITDLVTEFTNNGMDPNQATSIASILLNQLDTQNMKKISMNAFIDARLHSEIHKSRSNLAQLFKDIRDASIVMNEPGGDKRRSSLEYGARMPVSDGGKASGVSDIYCESSFAAGRSTSQFTLNKDDTEFDESDDNVSKGHITLHDIANFTFLNNRYRDDKKYEKVTSVKSGNNDKRTGKTITEKKSDENGNNKHTRYHSRNGSLSVDLGELSNLFSQFDEDGDGKLTFENFMNVFKSESVHSILMKAHVTDVNENENEEKNS